MTRVTLQLPSNRSGSSRSPAATTPSQRVPFYGAHRRSESAGAGAKCIGIVTSARTRARIPTRYSRPQRGRRHRTPRAQLPTTQHKCGEPAQEGAKGTAGSQGKLHNIITTIDGYCNDPS